MYKKRNWNFIEIKLRNFLLFVIMIFFCVEMEKWLWLFDKIWYVRMVDVLLFVYVIDKICNILIGW